MQSIMIADKAIEHIKNASQHLSNRWDENDLAAAKTYLEEIKDRAAIIEAEIKRRLYLNLGTPGGFRCTISNVK